MVDSGHASGEIMVIDLIGPALRTEETMKGRSDEVTGDQGGDETRRDYAPTRRRRRIIFIFRVLQKGFK
jgi:hypothetical protein